MGRARVHGARQGGKGSSAAVPASEANPGEHIVAAHLLMCHICLSKKGTVAPEHSFALFPYGDPTRSAATLAANPEEG